MATQSLERSKTSRQLIQVYPYPVLAATLQSRLAGWLTSLPA